MTVTELRRPAPPAAPSSPERAKLAEAIGNRDARRAELAAANSAVGKADAIWRAARQTHTEAATAAEDAKAGWAQHLMALATGTAGAAPLTIRAAREAAADAEAEEEAAKAALDAVRAHLENVQRFADLPERAVRESAAAVLRTSAPVAELIGEVQRLQRELVDKGLALLFLERCGALDLENVPVPGGSVSSPAKPAITRLQSPTSTWDELLKDPALSGAAPWRAAFEALLADAHAPLPA